MFIMAILAETYQVFRCFKVLVVVVIMAGYNRSFTASLAYTTVTFHNLLPEITFGYLGTPYLLIFVYIWGYIWEFQVVFIMAILAETYQVFRCFKVLVVVVIMAGYNRSFTASLAYTAVTFHNLLPEITLVPDVCHCPCRISGDTIPINFRLYLGVYLGISSCVYHGNPRRDLSSLQVLQSPCRRSYYGRL